MFSRLVIFSAGTLGPETGLFLLHPGSGGKQKLWAVAGWLSVINKLSAHHNIRFALLQGPADEGIVQYLRSQLESKLCYSRGKLAARQAGCTHERGRSLSR